MTIKINQNLPKNAKVNLSPVVCNVVLENKGDVCDQRQFSTNGKNNPFSFFLVQEDKYFFYFYLRLKYWLLNGV